MNKVFPLLLVCLALKFFFGLPEIKASLYETTLKEKLYEAVPGNYFVLEQSKHFTFLRIYDVHGAHLSLEEVTIPYETFARLKMPWRTWFERGAPGHTSWMLSQVNLQSGKIEEVFSFTHNGWVHIDAVDTFMPTLLNLQFQVENEQQRKKIGLPPGYGKQDNRPYWNPRLVVEGVTIPKIPFIACVARWPADGSELSRKIVEAYFPNASEMTAYPTYFPYWIEVEGKIGSARIRVVDSGASIQSIQTKFPHRRPQMVGCGRWEGDRFVIELHNPSHLHDFLVLAEECDSFFPKPSPLPYELKESEENTLISLKKEDISKVVSLGETVRFSIRSPSDLEFCLETKKITLKSTQSTNSSITQNILTCAKAPTVERS